MLDLPPFIAPQHYTDADAALAQVRRIYDNSVAHLREAMRRYVADADELSLIHI